MINVSRLYVGAKSASDGLRYGRHGGEGKKPASKASERRPVVVWNLTRSCNLRCLHCYTDSEPRRYEGELTTEEAKRVIEDLAAFEVPAVLFSGGEPLVRKDLFELVSYARSLGLRPTLSTNGTLIDEKTAQRIKEVGFTYVGISLDGIGEVNDFFRNVPGAFERAVEGIRNCVAIGQKVGLRMTLTRHNVHHLDAIFDFIEKEGIQRVCFYHLVYSGRGQSLLPSDLKPKETRMAIDTILERTLDLHQRGKPVEVLTVDNHVDGVYIYLKLLQQGNQRAEDVYELLKWNGGGLHSSGVGIGCIDFLGNVHPDQFWMHYSLGNVKQRPFSQIWQDESEPLLYKLRRRKEFLKGRCASCKWLDLCGGALRVRAEFVHGDPFAPDPACYLTDDEIGLNAPQRLPPAQAGAHAPPMGTRPTTHQPSAVSYQRDRSLKDAILNQNNELRLVFWETTAGCNLECIHCRRLDVAKQMMKDDLTSLEAMRLVRQIASVGNPILVLSGGEPLIRPDIYAIASYAVSRGLTVSLATNGTLIDDEVAQRIKGAGIRRVAVSLDGADSYTHDTFRRQFGSFDKAIEGILCLKRAGLEVQINTTLAKHNDGQLEAIYGLARELGAVALHAFLLVPVGCGLSIADSQMLSPQRIEEVLNELYELSRLGEMHVRATCAPHYFRILRQRAKAEGIRVTFQTHGMAAMTKGCLAGTAVCFISHKGEVFPCGYLPVEAGNIRKQNFKDIWLNSPVFQTLRNPNLLTGKCGICEFKNICMGCRARAYYATGDFMAEEPFCIYQPKSLQAGES